MNKQDLIEKIVLDSSVGSDDFAEGWNAYHSKLLSRISSLDLNGLVKIEEVWDMIYSSFPLDMENLSTMTPEQARTTLRRFIDRLSSLAPQEENKN